MSNVIFSFPWNFVSLDIKEISAHHELSNLGRHIYVLFILLLEKNLSMSLYGFLVISAIGLGFLADDSHHGILRWSPFALRCRQSSSGNRLNISRSRLEPLQKAQTLERPNAEVVSLAFIFVKHNPIPQIL